MQIKSTFMCIYFRTILVVKYECLDNKRKRNIKRAKDTDGSRISEQDEN